ncbi:MAG: glutamate formimidoyltransferase [Planctomycetes bacterium]|nr:glutamate formimidoyltransferase [Planctomycetota bacterium]
MRIPLYAIVPNVSEGRDPAVVEAIVSAVRAAGARVLRAEMDGDHGRAVITAVGAESQVLEAAFACVRAARDHVDLTRHRGQHPRVGACDVMPFVPLAGAAMEGAVALAHALGERVAGELGVPVYYYEHAARRPERRNLADVRNVGFEALARLALQSADHAPDAGGPALHPSAGAVCVGARDVLVAFNVNLDTADLAVAKAIARDLRARDGGLPGVKALGFALPSRGIVQVSMNLCDWRATGPARAFAAVQEQALARGVRIHSTEFIGVLPLETAAEALGDALLTESFGADRIIEHHLPPPEADAVAALDPFIDALASRSPVPGGGAAAALVGALAAALGSMTCNLTVGRKKFAAVEETLRASLARLEAARRELLALIREDIAAYDRIRDTRKAAAAPRDAALIAGARPPLRVMEVCAEVLEQGRLALTLGNPNVRSDALICQRLAAVALLSARDNVEVNLRDAKDRAAADPLLARARQLSSRAAALLAESLGGGGDGDADGGGNG